MWLLLQRYFIENINREFFSWSIFIIIFMFARNSAELFGILIIFSGMGFCERFFREIHSPTTGLNYFMIPATQEEKTVISIFMITVYYFGMMLVVYVIGNLVGTFLNNLLANVSFLSSSLKWFSYAPLQWSLFERANVSVLNNGVGTTVEGSTYVWTLFKAFIIIQAIFTLGSLYFKRSAIFKTILTLFFIGFVYAGLMITGIFSFELPNEATYLTNEQSQAILSRANISLKTFANIILYLFVPYLWVLSYFKLTEKEV